jgi:hypothetical protein
MTRTARRLPSPPPQIIVGRHPRLWRPRQPVELAAESWQSRLGTGPCDRGQGKFAHVFVHEFELLLPDRQLG